MKFENIEKAIKQYSELTFELFRDEVYEPKRAVEYEKMLLCLLVGNKNLSETLKKIKKSTVGKSEGADRHIYSFLQGL